MTGKTSRTTHSIWHWQHWYEIVASSNICFASLNVCWVNLSENATLISIFDISQLVYIHGMLKVLYQMVINTFQVVVLTAFTNSSLHRWLLLFFSELKAQIHRCWNWSWWVQWIEVLKMVPVSYFLFQTITSPLGK